MNFTRIPGHSDIKSKLIKAYNDRRMGHAITFLGESGSAGLSLGLALTQYILCDNPGVQDSCGNCPACKKMEKFIHPDVHFYFPTATSTDVTKQALSYKYYEQWRQLLVQNTFVTLSDWLETIGADKKEAIIPAEDSLRLMRDLALKSYESKYRFALIWLPEKLNISAANKLLKIIEEPPQDVFFLLFTEHIDAILPTVLSRTQIVRIGKAEEADLLNWLIAMKTDKSNDELSRIAGLADGNPSKAMKALHETLDDPILTADFIAWARLCYEAFKKMPQLIDWTDKMAAKPRDEQKSFLNYSQRFFRAGIMKNEHAEELMQTFPQESEHISKFAPFVNASNRDKLIEVFNQSAYHLERNANTRIMFMDLSIKFSQLIHVKNVLL